MTLRLMPSDSRDVIQIQRRRFRRTVDSHGIALSIVQERPRGVQRGQQATAVASRCDCRRSKEFVLSAEEEQTRILVMNITGFDVKNRHNRAGIQGLGRSLFGRSGAVSLEASAVCSAAKYAQSTKPFQLLLDSSCSPTAFEDNAWDRKRPAIFIAAKAKQWGNFKLLLMERGAKLETRLIHMAALADEPEIIHLLLTRGVSIISADAYINLEQCLQQDLQSLLDGYQPGGLWTPLHVAARFESCKATAALLRHGAHVNKGSSINQLTALYAIPIVGKNKDKIEVIKILMENGADLNAKTIAHYTPLHKAVTYETIDEVRFLVDRGADVNAITEMAKPPCA
jgi:hypothetical protein